MDKSVVCAGCGKSVGDGSSGSLGKGWNVGELLALIGVTIFMPPIGLIFGLIGLRNDNRRVKAAVLLTIAVIMSLLYVAIVLGL
jgi:hypothetical protein